MTDDLREQALDKWRRLFSMQVSLAGAEVHYDELLRAADQMEGAGLCSGQLIPDTTLSFSSARAGANPSLNW
jgi:hypothetical protein